MTQIGTATAKQKIFFPNLDGLRFICFLLVYLYHWDLNCAAAINNDTVRNGFHFLFRNGNIGVNIFFVLSGFLITYLLIKEMEMSHTVHLKNFYIRRLLRIWPLYYAIVAICFLAVPFLAAAPQIDNGASSNLILYLVFGGNFDLIRLWPQLPNVLPLVVLWSVSVEEQFYVVWPIVIKWASKAYLKYVFGAIVLLTILFRTQYTGDTDHDYSMRYFNTFSVIGDMAIGGLMAYYSSYESKLLSYIKNMSKLSIVLLYGITLALILYKQELLGGKVLLIFERLIFAILFAVIIVEQNVAQHSFFKFRSFKTMSKLGIYTYGLYCLQFFPILMVQKLFYKVGWGLGGSITNLIAATLSLLLLIALSMASFHLFEKYFLKWKDKFAIITK
jgi:peptidoglycan/LPS O-acetylase OafA/YrhL